MNSYYTSEPPPNLLAERDAMHEEIARIKREQFLGLADQPAGSAIFDGMDDDGFACCSNVSL